MVAPRHSEPELAKVNKYLDPRKYVGYLRRRLHGPIDTLAPAEPGASIAVQYQDFKDRMAGYQRSHTETKLHFGCGPRVLRGWINIDLAFEPYEDYLQYYTDVHYPPEARGSRNDFYAFDFRFRGIPIPSNSVDVIFHEDFIEHLSQRDQILFLAETRRVLKKGGIHRINTPDFVTSMKRHSDFERGFEGVYVEEWDRHIHLNVLSPAVLEEFAALVGYAKVIFTAKNESLAREQLPLEYRPSGDRSQEDGNIFADLIK
jgi:hypothetical protein